MHPHAAAGHAFSFDTAPRRIYWEITRSCGLACRHCRAEATLRDDPDQLTNAEGKKLLENLATFSEPKPHVVLTGGDPLERGDLFELIAHAKSMGLDVSVSPSATPRLTADVIGQFARAGVSAISLSIDGANATTHDDLRGVPGCFGRTLEAAKAAEDAKLMVQVNTLVSEETVDALPEIYELVKSLHVARWSLFFLVSVGRGTVLQAISAERCTRVLEWLADLPSGHGFVITTTEAPHYRRIQLSRKSLPMAESARSGYGIRDGNGVMFISHTGDVSPSGFLPLVAGNVRETDAVSIYRDAPLFTSLRQPTGLEGRCGICTFHSICGGSRARAFSGTGSPLGEDPLCTYQPEVKEPARKSA